MRKNVRALLFAGLTMALGGLGCGGGSSVTSVLPENRYTPGPGSGGGGEDDGGDGDDGTEIPPVPTTIEVLLQGLQAGWLVNTARLTDFEAVAESTVLSDGSPLTLSGSAKDVFTAVVLDAAGEVVETRTMGSPCTLASSRQLHVPRDYATIQAAVDAATPGDTVKVAPGTYTDAVMLRRGVCLLGSGAAKTILDAQGAAVTRVDLTRAPGSAVVGFTVRGVKQRGGCSAPEDPFACSGDWYSAGIYLGGTRWNDPTQDAPPLIANNTFEGNEIAVMFYWHGVAIVRNNVFVGNRNAFIANHFQDRTLVANNVFYANQEVAIGNQAAYLDIVNNIIARSAVGVHFEYIQTGWIRCNLFFGNAANQEDIFTAPPRFTIGSDGNVEIDPKFVNADGKDFHLQAGSPAINHGCFNGKAFDPDKTAEDIGAYGGPLGAW